MYFVDREKIEARLAFLEQQVALFSNKQDWLTPLDQAALERLTHTMIEVVLDVGNAMIDGFIMRDPGSYEDIIDILTDEKVISESSGKVLKALISYRKTLVQNYTEVNHEVLQNDFSKHIKELTLFAQNVRDYLLNELGSVTAFKS